MMGEPHPENRLSIEYHYPDCPACGADGGVAVIALKNHQLEEWECLRCGEQFDAPPGSDWHGVRDLPDRMRAIYIDCHIRDLPAVAVAPRHTISAGKVRELLTKARNRLDVPGEGSQSEGVLHT